MSGAARRIASIASAKASRAWVGRPSRSLTWRWTTAAPASRAPATSSAISSGVSGRCGCCSRVSSPPTGATVITRGPTWGLSPERVRLADRRDVRRRIDGGPAAGVVLEVQVGRAGGVPGVTHVADQGPGRDAPAGARVALEVRVERVPGRAVHVGLIPSEARGRVAYGAGLGRVDRHPVVAHHVDALVGPAAGTRRPECVGEGRAGGRAGLEGLTRDGGYAAAPASGG